MSFDPKSRSRLTPRDLPRFAENTLFHGIARAVCEADCLPRKELFEAWEVARRARRRFRGGRVLDLACGHALLAHILLLLDDSSPSAIAIDRNVPSSAEKIGQSLVAHWPRLAGRIQLVQAPLQTITAGPLDLLVSCHACGKLSDDVLDKAIAANARVVILPCCHELGNPHDGGLGGWLDSSLAIDVTRAARLERAGYVVHTQRIPVAITPKNRLLLAEPAPARRSSHA